MYKNLPLPPNLTFLEFWHVANFVLTTHGQPELTYGYARAWYDDYKFKRDRESLAAFRSKVKAAA
jgi:hypothetical protein